MALCLVVLAVIIVLISYWTSVKLCTYWRMVKLIEKIPGPKAVPLFGNTLQFKLDKAEFSGQLRELYETYGDRGIIRLWIGIYPMVGLTRAHTAEVLLRSNEHIEKSTNYDLLIQWLGTGLLTSAGEKWRTRRKMLTPTFHFSILNQFVEVFNQQALVLMDELGKTAEGKQPFDIFPFMGRCALDTICQTAMGVQVGAQRNHHSEYVQAVKKMSEILFYYERKPWLWIKPVYYLLGYGYEYDRCMKILKDFTNKVIISRMEERRQGGVKEKTNNRKAFLDLLLDTQDEHKLTLEDIREEVDTFMFEGHDTTASSMSWTTFLLGHHSVVQDKIMAEMDTIFGDDNRMPTSDDLRNMKYLECVIKEALRLYPPVPLFARRLNTELVDGEFIIPKGTNVVVAPAVIHRDRRLYGNNADSFVPERFESNAIDRQHAFAFVPFSAGSRNCIGQKFAMMEEKVILSTLVRYFRIVSEDPIEEVIPIPDLILRPADQIRVRLTPR